MSAAAQTASYTPTGSIAQLLTMIAVFILVLVLAWLSARFIAGYQKTGGFSGTNIEIVEAARLSQTQVAELLKIGDRYIAVAVGKDRVTKLGEWSADEMKLIIPEKRPGAVPDFKSVLKNLGKKEDRIDNEE